MANLSASPVAFPHGTSDVVSTSLRSIQLGARARDLDGNEYIYVDFSGTVYTGTPVQINNDFSAAKVGVAGRGAFGVATCQASSDQSGWVQIYGTCYVQLLGATAGVSPSDAANCPTTLSTTAQTKFWLPTTATSAGPEGLRWTSGNVSTTSGFYIDGLFMAHDASPGDGSLPPWTTFTSPSNVLTCDASFTGHAQRVFLNYPKIVHVNYGE